MRPKDILKQWIEAFNEANVEIISGLYAEEATNHQVADQPVVGRRAIREMFEREFSRTKMICMEENIFEDGDWAILEWKDPLGLRGCGFFKIINDEIIFQRGYWDKLSFIRTHKLPME